MFLGINCKCSSCFKGMQLSNYDRDTTPNHTYAIMTLSYVGAMLASNHALQWVSYPTQVNTELQSSSFQKDIQVVNPGIMIPYSLKSNQENKLVTQQNSEFGTELSSLQLRLYSSGMELKRQLLWTKMLDDSFLSG